MDINLSNIKKRKSFSKITNKPSKIVKTDEELNVEDPQNNCVSINNDESNLKKQSKTNKHKKSPKENKGTTTLKNGETSKILQKFQGIDSLKDNQKNEKIKRVKPLNKRDYLLQKLNERSQAEGKDAVLKSLNEKIDAILFRSELTKTAKRKLKSYKQLVNKISGDVFDSAKKQSEQDISKTKQKQMKKCQQNNKIIEKAKNKKFNIKSEQRNIVEQQKESDGESSDSDFPQQNVKVAKKQEAIFSTKNNIYNEINELEESIETENEEKESGEKDNSESEDDIDYKKENTDGDGKNKSIITKINAAHHFQKQLMQEKNIGEKKSRYVLFVGNISYDTTKKELEQHFERVGEVIDVRIPIDKESNKPRGFAYIEFADEALYQQALDLNGSQLKNRKIKVEYTQGGHKKSENKKQEIKSKNFKLHSMRKQGKFGGVNRVPNKRGFRGRGKN